jgi:hypothetical protein
LLESLIGIQLRLNLYRGIGADKLNISLLSHTARVTDLEILVVLVTRLLKRDLNRLINRMEPVEPWDKG